MKTVTREIVGSIARALITLEGSTTTLDVKTALRKRGYWAKQEMVREFMLDITSKDSDIQYVESGDGYRIYSFAAPTADEDDDTTSIFGTVTDTISKMFGLKNTAQPVAAPTMPSLAGTLHTPAPKPTIHPDDVIADYVVHDQDGLRARQYTGVTRAQAKFRWSRDIGAPFSCARTQKTIKW